MWELAAGQMNYPLRLCWRNDWLCSDTEGWLAVLASPESPQGLLVLYTSTVSLSSQMLVSSRQERTSDTRPLSYLPLSPSASVPF